jgi:hypothetical protein
MDSTGQKVQYVQAYFLWSLGVGDRIGRVIRSQRDDMDTSALLWRRIKSAGPTNGRLGGITAAEDDKGITEAG